jgi:hypothetical protein
VTAGEKSGWIEIEPTGSASAISNDNEHATIEIKIEPVKNASAVSSDCSQTPTDVEKSTSVNEIRKFFESKSTQVLTRSQTMPKLHDSSINKETPKSDTFSNYLNTDPSEIKASRSSPFNELYLAKVEKKRTQTSKIDKVKHIETLSVDAPDQEMVKSNTFPQFPSVENKEASAKPSSSIDTDTKQSMASVMDRKSMFEKLIKQQSQHSLKSIPKHTPNASKTDSIK